jgi:hypothetical protein
VDEAGAFFEAIRKGNAPEVERLLGGNPALARSDAGKTPAELARERGHGAVADILQPR